MQSFLLPGSEIHPHFDRNVRALGGPVQQTLGDLRTGVDTVLEAALRSVLADRE